MNPADMARRATVDVYFAGANITSKIKPYLSRLTYTDNEEDETDDLQIDLQDRDGKWLQSWLNEAVAAAAAAKLKISAAIVTKNWKGDGKERVLDCGTFELDSINASWPPSKVNISATSLPFSAAIRQTKKSRAWENYTRSKIAAEIAAAAGLGCMYEAAEDPLYQRVEQVAQSDIAFLSALCKKGGVSLKVTGGMIVLFDQAAYEAKPAVKTITRGDKSYINYKLAIGSASTQYKTCRVRYTTPKGSTISGTATDANVSGSEQQLEIWAKVADAAEAKQLATKKLREYNKFGKTASFTLPGNIDIVAGLTVQLAGFGGWSGKYIVRKAVHSVDFGGGGYTTQMDLRRVVEEY